MKAISVLAALTSSFVYGQTSGPFSLTGQLSKSTPATPSVGHGVLYFPAHGGAAYEDESGNIYGMPGAAILDAPPNSFWAGPASGSNAAPYYRPLAPSDFLTNGPGILAALQGITAKEAVAAVGKAPNIFSSNQVFQAGIAARGPFLEGSTTAVIPASAIRATYYSNKISIEFNSNDYQGSLGGFSGERGGWMQYGFYNSRNASQQGIEAVAARSAFGFSPAGRVCSLTNTLGRVDDSVQARNCLDDGSGNLGVSGRIGAALYTPRSGSEACIAGQFADDENYHYVCVKANTWKRVALSSF